jgi:signal transduction histidine kinase
MNQNELQAALWQSQERLIEVQRIGQMGSWELDWMSAAMTWSEEVYGIFEIDPALFGASYDAFMQAIYPDDREAVSKAYSESLKNRTSSCIDHRLLLADGRIKCVRECWSTYYDEDGKPVRSLGTVQDITALKESELHLEASRARLRELLVYQANRHELECKQISWDMHEDLLQNLTGVKMSVMLLESRSVEIPAHLVKMLPSMTSVLEKSIRLVREMVDTLRPTILNLGILPALEWLRDEFVKHPDRACKLEVSGEAAQLDEHSCLIIFRIAQKSLEVISRFGGTAKVSISLECNESDCLLVMRDESKEYNIDVSDSNFLSLIAMQVRVLEMGGEMAIFSAPDLFSAPDTGLIVKARLPVQAGG